MKVLAQETIPPSYTTNAMHTAVERSGISSEILSRKVDSRVHKSVSLT